MEMLKWMQSIEAKKISEDTKEKSWKDFKIKYPNADISKFTAETDFIAENHATQLIYISKRVPVI